MTISAEERPKRTALLSASPCLRANGSEMQVRIRNLSTSGLGGVSERPLTRDERIKMDIRGVGVVEGSVAWVRGTSFGMNFDDTIDLADFEVAKPVLAKPEHHAVMTRFRPVPASAYKRPGFNKR